MAMFALDGAATVSEAILSSLTTTATDCSSSRWCWYSCCIWYQNIQACYIKGIIITFLRCWGDYLPFFYTNF